MSKGGNVGSVPTLYTTVSELVSSLSPPHADSEKTRTIASKTAITLFFISSSPSSYFYSFLRYFHHFYNYTHIKNNIQELIDLYQNGITKIKHDEELILEEPNDKEKQRLRNAIISNTKVNMSSKDIAEKVMDELNIDSKYRDKLHKLVSIMEPNSLDEDKIRTLIDTNYNIM